MWRRSWSKSSRRPASWPRSDDLRLGVDAMSRALAAGLIVILVLAVVVPFAEACLECVALGLASFAVFTQLVAALTAPQVVYPIPGYYVPGYYYGPYGGAY